MLTIYILSPSIYIYIYIYLFIWLILYIHTTVFTYNILYFHYLFYIFIFEYGRVSDKIHIIYSKIDMYVISSVLFNDAYTPGVKPLTQLSMMLPWISCFAVCTSLYLRDMLKSCSDIHDTSYIDIVMMKILCIEYILIVTYLI